MEGRVGVCAGRRFSSYSVALAIGAVLLVILAACAIGPDYVKPGAPVPKAYKEDKGWKIAEPKDDVFRGPWWEIYGDSRLNALEEQVSISNQNIAIAEAQFLQAAALVQSARSAFFPTITANPGVTRALRSANVVTGSTPPGTTTVYTAPLNISSWEMDVWGRIRRTVEASRAGAQASAADLEGVRLSMQAALAQNYFVLRALDRQQELLDKTVTAYRKSVELTRNQYESGVIAKGDMLLAETQLKITEAKAIDIRVSRAQTEHACALLVGKPASDFSIPFLPLDAVPPAVPAGVPSTLLERRPDIASAERSVVAANAQIGVAKAAYFPTITLSGSSGYQSIDYSTLFSPSSRMWSVGSAMAQTVFDGGARAALNDQARAVYDQSVASYRQTVLTAFQQVEDNLAALRILEEEAKAQDDAVKVARQSVDFALNQYKWGLVNYLNVVVAEASAFSAETTAVIIAGRRMSASVGLVQALGGGWTTSSLPDASDIAEKRSRGVSAPRTDVVPAGQKTDAAGG